MDFDKFKSSKEEDGTALAYVVFKEHTLGYLFRLGNHFYLGVLHGSVIKGGISQMNSPYMLLCGDHEHVREATQKDFDDYRVSSKGHLFSTFPR